MNIPSYKIHNVLKTYSRRLIQAGRDPTLEATISFDGKQQAVIHQISQRIIATARRMTERQTLKESPSSWDSRPESASPPEKRDFAYTLQTDDGSSELRTLTLDSETVGGNNPDDSSGPPRSR